MRQQTEQRVRTASKGGGTPPGCLGCAVRNRSLCARCDNDALAKLERIKFTRHYDVGDVVVWAGDEMSFVGSVTHGIAALRQSMEDGRTQMVGLLLPSDFIGRPGRAIAPYDVVATSKLELCCFWRGPFETLFHETPALSEQLLKMTLDELDAAREWMVVLGRKTAREKLASLLAIIARRALPEQIESDQGVALDLGLTRGVMADFLGLTLETVSRQVSALKRDEVIRLDGARRIVIPDLALLIEESGEERGGYIY